MVSVKRSHKRRGKYSMKRSRVSNRRNTKRRNTKRRNTRRRKRNTKRRNTKRRNTRRKRNTKSINVNKKNRKTTTSIYSVKYNIELPGKNNINGGAAGHRLLKGAKDAIRTLGKLPGNAKDSVKRNAQSFKKYFGNKTEYWREIYNCIFCNNMEEGIELTSNIEMTLIDPKKQMPNGHYIIPIFNNNNFRTLCYNFGGDEKLYVLNKKNALKLNDLEEQISTDIGNMTQIDLDELHKQRFIKVTGEDDKVNQFKEFIKRHFDNSLKFVQIMSEEVHIRNLQKEEDIAKKEEDVPRASAVAQSSPGAWGQGEEANEEEEAAANTRASITTDWSGEWNRPLGTQGTNQNYSLNPESLPV